MTIVDRRYSVAEGQAVKAPCRAATTANITLSGEQTIDGIAVVDGDRVLVKNQATASQNGIYTASTGQWSRTRDFDGSYDVVTGSRVFVTSGTANGGVEFTVSTSGAITIDTSSIAFTSIGAATIAAAAAAAASATAAATSKTSAETAEATAVAAAAALVNAIHQYDTRALAIAATIPSGVNAVRLLGYSAVGDGGTAVYKKVIAQPSHVGKFQSADGAWWEIAETILTPEMFGADGTGGSITSTALQNAMNTAVAISAKLRCPRVTYDVGGHILQMDDYLNIECDGTTFLRSVDVGAAAYDAARPPVFYALNKTGVRLSGARIEYTAGTSTNPATNTYLFSGVTIESCTDAIVRDVRVTGRFYTGISMTFSTDFVVQDCYVQGVVNRAFYINGSADNFTFIRCSVEGYEVGGSTRYTQYGFNMLPASGQSVIRGRLIGCDVRNTGFQGFEWGSLVSDVLAIGCSAYNIGFHGFLFQTADGSIPQWNGAIGCTAVTCQVNGFYVLNANYILLDACIGRSNVNANFEFDGAQFCNFTGLLALSSSAGYGVWLKNSIRCGLSNSRLVSNNFGMIEANTCTANIFVGNHYNGNTTTNSTSAGVGSSSTGNL